MTKAVKLKDNDSGVYLTKELTESQFLGVFSHIQREQREKRRAAKRTLSPALLRKKSLSATELAKIGNKADGTPFTNDDLKELAKNRAKYKKKRGDKTGITYLQIVSKSKIIDVKRANNTSNDNLGITKASLIALRKGNIAMIRVKASSKSKHQEHLVRVRFEEWNDHLENASPDRPDDYVKAVKAACRGRMSFDCDCGRHQYWYRYLATIGNYQLSPQELSFTKVRNPLLVGVACKHVIKSVGMLQSISWHKPLAAQMKHQAKTTGFADDHIKSRLLNDKELKSANYNRKTTVNQDKARAEYKKYLARMDSIKKKMRQNPDAIKKARELLTTARKAKAQVVADNRRLKADNRRLETQNKKLAKQTAKAQKRIVTDQVKIKLHGYLDAMRDSGINDSIAIAKFAEKNGLSVAAVNKIKQELDA